MVINSLVAPLLWHKMIVLQPPVTLVSLIQKCLLDFFWDGKHWLKAETICLPLGEGGHGLVDILCRMMAFHISAARRFIFLEALPWKSTASLILKQAGMLGYNHELFFMELQHVDALLLPDFSQHVLHA